jgi:hypothetical protein
MRKITTFFSNGKKQISKRERLNNFMVDMVQKNNKKKILSAST